MHVTTQAPQTYKYAGVVPTLGPSHTPGALSLQPCPHSGLPGHGALPCSTDTGLEDLRVTYPLGRCISIRWEGQRGQGRTWELAGMCACRAPLKVLGGAGGGRCVQGGKQATSALSLALCPPQVSPQASGQRPEESSSRGPVGPGYGQGPGPSLQAPVGLTLPTSSTSVPATPFPSACL